MKLENNILFKGIDGDDCRRMIACFNVDVKKFSRGSNIKNSIGKIGFILSGIATVICYDVNGVRTIIEILGEQGIFSDLFTYTSGNHNEDEFEIIVENDCEVMYVNHAVLTKRCERACQCHSIVIENMLELITKKMISLSERINLLRQRTIEDKLMSFLRITEKKTVDGKISKIPFSITALSDYLCVNRSALQREITRLRKSGVITISKRKFKLIHNNKNENEFDDKIN